ncbi:hypothetical protein BOTBODRAFT_29656 [Botryobasidium botryosum FD-172 SS1]|uniref:Uncharacterized protein n=1 Tax=Botryobasidium botryosum (strain FD-172 SS1) TaxID=930990 RepID=A0A067N125_BOTB1|nr:hypothetical protein BOTBODRAFT_29656 [Botryobasidium botryosum FD-172 SS1]
MGKYDRHNLYKNIFFSCPSSSFLHRGSTKKFKANAVNLAARPLLLRLPLVHPRSRPLSPHPHPCHACACIPQWQCGDAADRISSHHHLHLQEYTRLTDDRETYRRIHVIRRSGADLPRPYLSKSNEKEGRGISPARFPTRVLIFKLSSIRCTLIFGRSK